MAIGELNVSVKADIGDIRTALNTIRKEQDKLKEASEASLNTQNTMFGRMQSNLNKLGAAIGATFVIDKIVSFGKAVLGLSGNLEQNRIAFTTMLGSAERANVLLKELSDFAKKTPFELTGLREQAKQLLAFGFSAEEIIPTLQSLGDISAGVGIDKLPRLTYALGQVRAAGKLTGQDLRQFTETGVPLLEELSRITGISTQEMAGNIGNLNISYQTVQQALQNLSGEGGKFAGLMEAQSSSLLGSVSNLQDSLNQLGESIGNFFSPAATSFVQRLTSVVNLLNSGSSDTGISIELKRLQGEVNGANKVIVELNNQMSNLKDQFDNGKIGSAQYSSEMSRLMGAISIQNEELRKLGEQQSKVNELQKISSDLSSKYQSETDKSNKKVSELSDMLKSNKIAFNEGTISQKEYNETNKTITDELKKTNKSLIDYGKQVDSTRALVDILAGSNMSAAETKAYLSSLKISNGGDISKLNAEQLAAYNLGEEYLKAYKKKLLMANIERSGNQSDIAKKGGLNYLLGGKQAIDSIQKEIDANNEKIKQIDALKAKSADISKGLGNTGGGGTTKTPTPTPPGGGSNKKNDDAKKLEEKKQEALHQLELEKISSNAEIRKAQKSIDIRKEATQKAQIDEEYKNQKLAELSKEEQKLAQDTALQKTLYALSLRKVNKEISDEQYTMLKDKATAESNANKEAIDGIYQASNAIKEYNDKIAETIKKFADLRKQATEDIRQINQSLTDLDTQKEGDIANRYITIVDEIDRLNKQQELSNEDITKRNDLEQERQLIMGTISSTILDQAVAYDKLSETQKIIKKADEDRAVLLEKQAIAQALQRQDLPTDGTNPVKNLLSINPDTNKVFYDNEKGALVEITDVKNQEYARDFINKQTALQLELAEEQKVLLQKQFEYQQFVDNKKLLETNFTNFLKGQIDLQKSYVDGLIKKYNEAAAARANAGAGSGGSSLPGRETGGPVVPGQPYIVGEKRAEVFVPNQSGMIIPSIGEYIGSAMAKANDAVDRVMKAQIEKQAQMVQNISQDKSMHIGSVTNVGDNGFKQWMDEMRRRLK